MVFLRHFEIYLIFIELYYLDDDLLRSPYGQVNKILEHNITPQFHERKPYVTSKDDISFILWLKSAISKIKNT